MPLSATSPARSTTTYLDRWPLTAPRSIGRGHLRSLRGVLEWMSRRPLLPSQNLVDTTANIRPRSLGPARSALLW